RLRSLPPPCRSFRTADRALRTVAVRGDGGRKDPRRTSSRPRAGVPFAVAWPQVPHPPACAPSRGPAAASGGLLAGGGGSARPTRRRTAFPLVRGAFPRGPEGAGRCSDGQPGGRDHGAAVREEEEPDRAAGDAAGHEGAVPVEGGVPDRGRVAHLHAAGARRGEPPGDV